MSLIETLFRKLLVAPIMIMLVGWGGWSAYYVNIILSLTETLLFFRNLLLAPIMSKSLSDQETMFSELWSEPVESYFTRAGASSNLEMFNKILYQFVTEMSEKLQHVSKVQLHQLFL